MKRKFVASVTISMFALGLSTISQAGILTFDHLDVLDDATVNMENVSQVIDGGWADKWQYGDLTDSAYNSNDGFNGVIEITAPDDKFIKIESFDMAAWVDTTPDPVTMVIEGWMNDSWATLSTWENISLSGPGHQSFVTNYGTSQYSAMRLSWGTDFNAGLDNLRFSTFSSPKLGLDQLPPAPVPEPATMLLFGTGLVGLAAIRRKKTAK